MCPAGSKTPENCPGPFYEANVNEEKCVYAYQNIGIMIAIVLVVVFVTAFICVTAQKQSIESPQRQNAEERRFRPGPRQIYDPAKTNFQEDDIYFSGMFSQQPRYLVTGWGSRIYVISSF